MQAIQTKLSTSLSEHMENAEFDLIVLGSGAAGFSAALSAASTGARVLLVESTAFLGGTSALSAATAWIPCSAPGLKINPGDSLADASAFLDHAVGNMSDRQLRQKFLQEGPAAVAHFADNTALQFQVRPVHPDYLSELPFSVKGGRAIEPVPFDGRLLGSNLALVRPPIAEFTVLGGMMVDRDDIFHLLRLGKSIASFRHSARILLRHFIDKLLYTRSTRLVMGNALIARMLYSYILKGGKVTTNTRATALLRDQEKVHSVMLEQTLADGTLIQRTLRTRHGVVLATGGFNRHPEKRVEKLKGIQMDWCPGAPGHTGKALDLALGLGAAWCDSPRSHAFWAPVSLRRRKDQSLAVFPHFVMDRAKPGMLTVDGSGKRYLNESTSYHLFGLAMQERQKLTSAIPSWLICDSTALHRYGLGMIRPGTKKLDEFLADGYLRRADSLEELGKILEIEPAQLVQTVERFNSFSDSAEDADFQRGTTFYQRSLGDPTVNAAGITSGANPSLGALRTAPFYAIALYPGDIGASSGLKTNEHAQVLDTHAKPVCGLYACGNDMQSIMGGIYPAPGITIGPALVFGHIAATHALANSAGSVR